MEEGRKRVLGIIAGPPTTLPLLLKREPWQGQANPSFERATVQPRCVHVLEIA